MRRLLLTRPRGGEAPTALTGAGAGALVAAAALVGLTAGPAAAHGDLVEGSPGPGDDVAVGTDLLRLEFTELDPDSRPLIAVRGPDGEPVAIGQADVADGRTICARSAPLEAGVTTIDYSVLSLDGDRQSGSYTFEVSPAGTAAEPADCDPSGLAAPGEAQTIEEMTTGSLPTGVFYGLGALGVLAIAAVVRRVRADRSEQPDHTA